MKARSLAGTTTSASGCWKKNMYQLRLSCTGDKNACAIAPPGGTAMPTTLAQRSGSWTTAP